MCELDALNAGCAGGMLVMSCFERFAVGTSDDDGKTNRSTRVHCLPAERLGRIKHMGRLWSQESSRKGLFGLNVIDTGMNTADIGTKYLTFAFCLYCV